MLDDKFFIDITNGFANLIDSVSAFIDGIGGIKTILMAVFSYFLSVTSTQIQPAIDKIKQGLEIAFTGYSSSAEKTAAAMRTQTLAILNDETAILKQKELIHEIHQMGGKVMLSSHTFRFLTMEETIAHCKALENRGADWVKIAVTANSPEELSEVNRTTIELKKQMKVPFFHCCMGQYGKLHRVYSGLLGSKIVLCVQNYNANSNPKEQPLLRSTKAVMDNLDFTIARDDASGTVRNI